LLSRLPVVSGRELIKILAKHFGFRVLRQRGSHVTLTNDISFITVPMHPELDPGTLKAILNDARVGREELLRYL
jgi:predicted RNA binding protein YcfA (HicA-like mRNA interferase family)